MLPAESCVNGRRGLLLWWAGPPPRCLPASTPAGAMPGPWAWYCTLQRSVSHPRPAQLALPPSQEEPSQYYDPQDGSFWGGSPDGEGGASAQQPGVPAALITELSGSESKGGRHSMAQQEEEEEGEQATSAEGEEESGSEPEGCGHAAAAAAGTAAGRGHATQSAGDLCALWQPGEAHVGAIAGAWADVVAWYQTLKEALGFELEGGGHATGANAALHGRQIGKGWGLSSLAHSVLVHLLPAHPTRTLGPQHAGTRTPHPHAQAPSRPRRAPAAAVPREVIERARSMSPEEYISNWEGFSRTLRWGGTPGHPCLRGWSA